MPEREYEFSFIGRKLSLRIEFNIMSAKNEKAQVYQTTVRSAQKPADSGAPSSHPTASSSLKGIDRAIRRMEAAKRRLSAALVGA